YTPTIILQIRINTQVKISQNLSILFLSLSLFKKIVLNPINNLKFILKTKSYKNIYFNFK
ncbi:hypothetical protein, partial [Acinetobacter baumannii]